MKIMQIEVIGLNTELYTFPITETGAELYDRMMDKLSRSGYSVHPVFLDNLYAFEARRLKRA